VKTTKQYYNEFISSFPEEKTSHPAFQQIIMTYARMCNEEDKLQKYIDKNGFTYECVNRDGAVLHKKYPQHGSLEKIRGQKTACFRTLIKYLKDEEDEGNDDGSLLR